MMKQLTAGSSCFTWALAALTAIVIPGSLAGPAQLTTAPSAGADGGQPAAFMVEGPLLRVGIQNNIILVMGVEVVVPSTARIHSAAAELTIESLAGPPLPGRSQPGFVAGTAIVNGTRFGDLNIAEDVFVEPAEHVLVGTVTSPSRARFEILGMHIRLIDDPRMPTTVQHPLGFEIHLHTVPAGSTAAAEGYVGNDGDLYAVHIEAQGRLVHTGPQTSVLRASCDEGRFEVRGGSTWPTGTVQVYTHPGGQLIGIAAVEPDVTGMGRYRLNASISFPCPQSIRVENSNGSSVIVPLR
jgi:hypothetical protein